MREVYDFVKQHIGTKDLKNQTLIKTKAKIRLKMKKKMKAKIKS